MIIASNSRVVIVGFTNSGKSIRAQWLARQWIPQKAHVFIVDPLNSWPNWDGVVFTAADAAKREGNGFRLHRLYSTDPEEVELFIELAQLAPNSLLVIDESAGLFTSRLESNSEAYHKFIVQGRRYNQTLIQLGQYFSQIPPSLRMQAYVFMSHMAEGGALKWTRERLGGEKPPQIPRNAWLVVSPDGESATLIRIPDNEFNALVTEQITNEMVGAAAQVRSPHPSDAETSPEVIRDHTWGREMDFWRERYGGN